MLTITNVSKKIKNTKLLSNISMQGKQGEVIGLVGPNGAGKTTLMKIISGLYKKNSGEIVFNNLNLDTDFKSYIEQVGAMIEEPIFFPDLTGKECLTYYAKLRNISPKEVDTLLFKFDLKKAENKRIKKYSLGMRQRLGLCQALLSNPDLLILDEPFNGLDPTGVEDLSIFIKKLKEENKLIIISSHTLNELEILCDKLIVINQGHILSEMDTYSALESIFIDMKTSNNIKAKKILQANLNINFEYSKDSNELRIKKDSSTNITDIMLLLKSEQIDIIHINEQKKTLKSIYEDLIPRNSKDVIK